MDIEKILKAIYQFIQDKATENQNYGIWASSLSNEQLKKEFRNCHQGLKGANLLQELKNRGLVKKK